MKAMILKKPGPVSAGPLRFEDLPDPEPGPGQIRVKVHACGICHTDLHTIEGDLPLSKLPIIPGHQVVGTVDRVGQGVTRFGIGDRVGLAWLHSACGTCAFCIKGLENLCGQALFTGYHVHGGYAEYVLALEAFAYTVPDIFPDEEAAPLLCAGIIGYRALRLSGVQPGERLGLYGFGASAHITIQIARDLGREVYVFSRGREHLKLAQALGASWTGQAQDTPPARLNSAIIFAPAGTLVPEALRVLEKGGTLVLAGITMSRIPELDYTQHLYFEKTVRSVANSTRKDGEDFLKIASRIPVRTKIESFPLNRANQALGLLKQGKIRGAGVLRML